MYLVEITSKDPKDNKKIRVNCGTYLEAEEYIEQMKKEEQNINLKIIKE